MLLDSKATLWHSVIATGGLILLTTCWKSHSFTTFNGLATPLFLIAVVCIAATAPRYTISVTKHSLAAFMAFGLWIMAIDVLSAEPIPALAKDTHWFLLPVASLVFGHVFRESPLAFQAIRVGASACIINLLLVLWLESEWYTHWHYPPVFGHIRHLGLSIGFMTLILYAKEERPGFPSILFRASRLLGLALVFWSGTRASILALILCVFVFVWHDRRWAPVFFMEATAAALLSLIPPSAFPKGGLLGSVGKSLSARSLDALSSSRIAIWKTTLIGLLDTGTLWSGVGGNGFIRLQTVYGVTLAKKGHIQAHNGVIQGICDWGLVGVTLAACFLYQSVLGPLLDGLRKGNPTAISGIVYILVTGMLDATLYHLEHLIYLAIAIGLLHSDEGTEPSASITVPSPLIIVFLLSLALPHFGALEYRIGLPWYFPTK